MSSIKLIDKIVDTIKSASDTLGVDVYDLTKAEVLESGVVSEWDLRKLGGLAAIRKAHFPLRDAKLSAKSGVTLRKAYVNQLEKIVGNQEYFNEEVVARIEEVLAKNPIQVNKHPQKYTYKKPSKHDRPREIVAVISDTHFGLNIEKQEIVSNEYSWAIAARRMGKLAEQIATYKIEHRASTPRLRLCLGGDLAQGIIHLDDRGTGLITEQIIGSLSILVQMIDYLRGFYKEIVVECTPCNHLRLTHKAPGRATAQKWDSFATLLHAMLQTTYRAQKDVIFHVPKTPFTDFEVLGHRFFMTHGDTIINVGNPGNSLDVKRIAEQVNNLNSNIPVGEKKYEVVIVGHVHVPVRTAMSNGCDLIINGSASGTDGYAQSIGIFGNNPVQTIFEATEEYPVGDYRQVRLADATYDTKYEKIIRPYNLSIEIPKI